MFRELRKVYSMACGECTSLEKPQGLSIVRFTLTQTSLRSATLLMGEGPWVRAAFGSFLLTCNSQIGRIGTG